ncbi:MAG: DinB family protein [Caldilineaceae bacterium]|nr:DinB family protein [Caldilineaceae bacterium]
MTNDQTARQANIEAIEALPGQVAALTAGLTAEQLTTPYDKGEWTIAQNVHHLCDSHMNSYIRCKLIATEERPPLKPYDQDVWARFPDAEGADLAASLAFCWAGCTAAGSSSGGRCPTTPGRARAFIRNPVK